MTKRHKVFVSYHHDNDEVYRTKFDKILENSDIAVLKSVVLGDINSDSDPETIRKKIREEHLQDSTVTVVLVGTETWKRKYVDYEIYYSLRETPSSQRSGVLGIILPSHPSYYQSAYDQNTVPPRLNDNVICGCARMIKWTESPIDLQNVIHETFENRNKILPNNSRPLYQNNRS